MDNSLKQQDSEEANALLSFIKEVQDGKFTVTKPEVVQITYRRLEIQEQDKSIFGDENVDDLLLFGTSY